MDILATSGGFRPDRRTWLTAGPIIEFAFELAGKPERPKFCYVGTALGDNPLFAKATQDAFIGRDVVVSNLAAFPMPSVEDVRAHLLAQDVVWVGRRQRRRSCSASGGCTAGTRSSARRGRPASCSAGCRAGSLCWHIGGTTDSFGPELRPVTNGLALLPYSNGVHYDSERAAPPALPAADRRRHLPARVRDRRRRRADYRGTELVEAVTDRPGANAYRVERGRDGKAIEQVIEPRLVS